MAPASSGGAAPVRSRMANRAFLDQTGIHAMETATVDHKLRIFVAARTIGVKGVLTGDLGESMRIKEPVLDLILQKLPVTIQLASMAIVIALTAIQFRFIERRVHYA